MEEKYSPALYQRDRLQLMTTIGRLAVEGSQIQSLHGRKRKSAQAAFDERVRSQAGSIVGTSLELRRGLLGLYDDVYDVWERNGGMTVDASKWIEQDEPSLDLKIPPLPESVSEHLFVHMGKQKSLEIAALPGNAIEGVHVSATMIKGDPAILLATLCRRGGRPKMDDSLEVLYLNQSSIVFTKYSKGQFELVDGAPEMVGDPAVDLANRIALQQYALTLNGVESFFERIWARH